jgi:glycosyltransferase involved in cell wall biosynthesis
MKFAIVTPSYNPGHFILETLQSVISQSGDFSICYHVQDAGSTDGTLDILESQIKQITNGNTAIQCRELLFSFASGPDNGMYDAINQGVKHIQKKLNPDIILWINADDRLDNYSLSNIADYFKRNPNIDWITGRTLHLDEMSNITIDRLPHKYNHDDLVAGKHDGINLPFVTQEATVWRAKLWNCCGELDSRLKFAGDYEYWRRAARMGFNLESVDIRIGYHRKRSGQLSSIGCYYDEINILPK